MNTDQKLIELQLLLNAADVKNFVAGEYGRLLRPNWTGPRRQLPDTLEHLIPCAILWDLIRVELGSKIRLSSTYRPPEYNTQSGQSDTSYHLHGAAADGVPVTASYEDLERAVERVCNRESTRAAIADRFGCDVADVRIGYGFYPESHNRFVHADCVLRCWDIWAPKRSKAVTRFR
jgi:hypothetical protein